MKLGTDRSTVKIEPRQTVPKWYLANLQQLVSNSAPYS
jgi:hypothetical protein